MNGKTSQLDSSASGGSADAQVSITWVVGDEEVTDLQDSRQLPSPIEEKAVLRAAVGKAGKVCRLLT